MIFVILGSQKFQFDRLLKEIDKLVGSGKINEEIFAQIGYSDYRPKNFKFKKFLDREEFNSCINKSQTVITHGGTGAIINALKMEKKVIAVPRLAKFKEHIDDHQIQIVKQFTDANLISACMDTEELYNKYLELEKSEFEKYETNTHTIIQDIKSYVNSEKILVVANMYPSKIHKSYGVFVERFCDELDAIGVDFDKSVMYKASNKIDKLFNYIKFYLGTVYKIITRKYGLVYIHYPSYSALPVLMMRKIKKIKVITNIHGSDLIPENKRQEKMISNTYKSITVSERVVVPSEYFKQKVCDLTNAQKEKVVVYPSCGVNRDKFYELDEVRLTELKNRYKITDETKCVGYVGRISDGKGWDTYVKAVSKLKYDHTNNKYIMVGDGPKAKELDRLINQLQLKDKILRIPLVGETELNEIYNLLDIFVFPTEREGESLGLVAVEAMTCGCIVLASDFAAPKYYIHDDYNGYKFEAGNSNELGQLLNKFLSIPEERRNELSNNAKKTAEEFDNVAIREILKGVICN